MTGTPGPVTVAMRFCPSHPLAALARERCAELHGRRPLRGTVACGACWEHVIRVDAAFAAAEDLPQETPAVDPGLIDEVAVDRACAGFSVPLTVAEVTAAVLRLRDRGVSFEAIGARLGMAPDRAYYLARTLTPAVRAPARRKGRAA